MPLVVRSAAAFFSQAAEAGSGPRRLLRHHPQRAGVFFGGGSAARLASTSPHLSRPSWQLSFVRFGWNYVLASRQVATRSRRPPTSHLPLNPRCRPPASGTRTDACAHVPPDRHHNNLERGGLFDPMDRAAFHRLVAPLPSQTNAGRVLQAPSRSIPLPGGLDPDPIRTSRTLSSSRMLSAHGSTSLGIPSEPSAPFSFRLACSIRFNPRQLGGPSAVRVNDARLPPRRVRSRIRAPLAWTLTKRRPDESKPPAGVCLHGGHFRVLDEAAGDPITRATCTFLHYGW